MYQRRRTQQTRRAPPLARCRLAGDGPADPGLAVDMARTHDVPVPATSLLHQLYNASSALGDGRNDFAAIVKRFESWAGIEVRGA
jgi:hypothetical protein